MTTTGDSRTYLLVIAFMFELLKYVGPDGHKLTMDEIWKHVVWSLYWLYEGVHPDRDANNKLYTSGPAFRRKGEPLAGGYFAPVWANCGDLDYMHKEIQLADFNKPSEPCSLCGCNSLDIPWAACTDGHCVWQLHIWSNATYALAYPNRHRMMRHLPGVGITTYIPDVMHCKNLGSDKSFVGSTLRNLTHHILGGTISQH